MLRPMLGTGSVLQEMGRAAHGHCTWGTLSTAPQVRGRIRSCSAQGGSGERRRRLRGKKKRKMSFPAAPAVWRLIGRRLVWSGAESLIPNRRLTIIGKKPALLLQ